MLRMVLLIIGLGMSSTLSHCLAGEPWRVGFGKADITPTQPLRLSGYSARAESHVGVADSLHVRSMVVSPGATEQDRRTLVMVSIDSILVTNAMTVEIAAWLDEKYRIPRGQLVLCSTHSHAAPHVDGGLVNLYRDPSTPEQEAATKAYTRRMVEAIQSVIVMAMERRTPAHLAIGQAEVGFAIHRRLLKDGIWSGFGEVPDGQVDHRLRFLGVRTPDGQLLGGAYLYACHCTTLGGDFNQISGDWAGLSASRLESLHPQAVFLPIIGCGADANPSPRGMYEYAEKNAMSIVDGVESILQRQAMIALDEFPVAHFGYAGLAPEQPTDERLAELGKSDKPTERRWSERMQQIRQERGRLPETYPMPIHTWQFGDRLTWVFLGGEVVVDYQFRIEKELPSEQTWVAAYTDDVFAYVASEKMRAEAGYEVDFSMIYYLQPGRWQSGTQALIVRRTAEIFRNQLTESPPLSASEALESIRVPDGFRVELVAGEPLVQDPINLAFGPDGRVWVVEMSDYPNGAEGGGRVRWLRDRDGNGTLDEGQLFLAGLSFPTSVFPWRDGAIIIAAPDIFFAADRDGDGIAEFRETLITGFSEANPQHRANGFEIGLDGWLHLGTGSGTKTLRSLKTGLDYQVENRDIAWNPDTGEIRTTSGETQFVRSRNSFGQWFGNSNSRPMFQYAIEDRYLKGQAIVGGTQSDLFAPPSPPSVYPRSLTMDRFNDLFAFNRFTSACSAVVVEVPGVVRDEEAIGFVCEPVHNLVARVVLEESKGIFKGSRHAQDQDYDFFTSTDSWSRPVRVVNAPDGTIWIVDMVRKVIEHPEWIPLSWQERLDLRGGAQLGRIYRVYRDDFQPTSLPAILPDRDSLSRAFSSDNRAVRDLGLLQLMQSRQVSLQYELRCIAHHHPLAAARASALGGLIAVGWLDSKDLQRAYNDRDPRIVRLALEFTESFAVDDELRQQLVMIPSRVPDAAVDRQWVLTMNALAETNTTDGLVTIARRSRDVPWVGKALALVQEPAPAQSLIDIILNEWIGSRPLDASEFGVQSAIVERLWKRIPREARQSSLHRRFNLQSSDDPRGFTSADLVLLNVAARHRDFAGQDGLVDKLAEKIRLNMLNRQIPIEDRKLLVHLLGSGIMELAVEIDVIRHLLLEEESPSLRLALLEALRRVDSKEIPTLIAERWEKLSNDQRRTASTTLLSRPNWSANFVSFLEEKKMLLEDLDPSTLQSLSRLRDRSLRSRVLRIIGEPTPRSQIVGRYLTEMPTPAADEYGARLYREHCVACHEATAARPMIGPPLNNLRHWTIDQWVTAILDPNRSVAAKYYQTMVLTDSDQAIQGLLIEQSSQGMRLALPDGTFRELLASEIADAKTTAQSLMPEGFEQKFSPDQLSALIGYLRDPQGNVVSK